MRDKRPAAMYAFFIDVPNKSQQRRLFQTQRNDLCDLVYDRGALAALSSPMRKSYAKVTEQSLKKGGKYLLIAYEYDQAKMEGPSFAVDGAEIRGLYRDRFTIRLMESERPDHEGPRRNVYILEKIN